MSTFDPSVLRALARVEDASLRSVERVLAPYFVAEKEPTGVTVFIPNWNQRSLVLRAIRSALRAVDALESAGFSRTPPATFCTMNMETARTSTRCWRRC